MKLKLIEEQGYLYTEDKKWHLPLNNNPILLNLGLLPEIDVEDDVEKMAEDAYQKELIKSNQDVNWIGYGKGIDGIEKSKWKKLWINAYKAATKTFTEDDVRKAILLTRGSDTPMEEIIEKLKQPKTPAYFIAEMGYTHCDRCPNGFEQYFKTTTNSEGKQVLLGTYIYK